MAARRHAWVLRACRRWLRGQPRYACDPLAECKLDSKNKPICGVCAVGFAGSGSTGCIAALIDLKLSGATLQPEFSPEQTDYQVELPLLAESPIVHPSQPAGVTVRIDGAIVESGAGWTAPAISAGNSLKVSVIASAPAHMGRTYTLTLQRTLRAPAVLKAQNPAADDQFGSELGDVGRHDRHRRSVRRWWTEVAPRTVRRRAEGQRRRLCVRAQRQRSGAQQAYLKADPPLEGATFERLRSRSTATASRSARATTPVPGRGLRIRADGGHLAQDRTTGHRKRSQQHRVRRDGCVARRAARDRRSLRSQRCL